MSELRISTDPAELDVERIHAFLSQAYWSRGIPLDVVRRAIAGSFCFGAYIGSELIGFARAISDGATFAYLADVFVLEPYRGRGFAKRLVQATLDDPRLHGLRRWLLVTRDAHGLYAGLGFTPATTPENIMEITRRDIYLQPAAPARVST